MSGVSLRGVDTPSTPSLAWSSRPMHTWSDLSPSNAVMTDTELTFIHNAIANSIAESVRLGEETARISALVRRYAKVTEWVLGSVVCVTSLSVVTAIGAVIVRASH